MGAKNKLLEQRDRDFLIAFDAVVKKLGSKSFRLPLKTIIELTAKSEAKRYYVTTDSAIRRINNIEYRGKSGSQYKEKDRMFNDIYKEYLRIKKENPDWNKYDIVNDIVTSKAKCFYLDPKTARVLFYKLTKSKK